VPLDKSSVPGKLSSELHPYQENMKFVPLDKSSVPGNSVSELQLSQLLLKIVPLDVSILGNSFSDLHSYQQ
jgi:hypothetical protein